jgi:GcrA cell cycle regulator
MTWVQTTTTEEIDRVRSLAEKGLSAAQIATEIGAASRHVIVGIVQRNGIKLGGSNVTWTADRIETVRKLAMEGFSAAQVANQLGNTTRNAVVGIAHRNKIYFKGGLDGAYNKERTQVRRPRPRFYEQPACVIVDRNSSLMALEKGDCRFPIGDPQDADFHFCGAPQIEGLPYCAGHCRIAYLPRDERNA